MATVNVVILGNEKIKENVKNLEYLKKLSSKIVYANGHIHGFNSILNEIMAIFKLAGLEKLYFVFSDGIIAKANPVKDGENSRYLKYISDNDKAFLVLIPCVWQHIRFKSNPKVYLAETIINI